MRSRAPRDVVFQMAIATMLAVSGYIHAKLYIDGYRFIHVVGALFLLQASASLAIALLVLLGAPLPMRAAAGATAGGALLGFALSRTVGVLGFTEHGWQPSPEAALSVAAETIVVLLVLRTLTAWCPKRYKVMW